jgi:hypothetical protein
MLRGNLATRPFYNERVVTIAIVGVLVLAAVVTFINGRELMALTGERAALASDIAQDRAEAVRINDRTAATQRTVDRATLLALASASAEANDLIAWRTFSWTAFFGLIERTLPIDVRLMAVSPRTERGVFRIQMSVAARDLVNIDEFTGALLATGAFRDVVPTETRPNDDNTFGAILEALYFPVRAEQATGAPAEAAASAPAPAASGTGAAAGGRP